MIPKLSLLYKLKHTLYHSHEMACECLFFLTQTCPYQCSKPARPAGHSLYSAACRPPAGHHVVKEKGGKNIYIMFFSWLTQFSLLEKLACQERHQQRHQHVPSRPPAGGRAGFIYWPLVWAIFKPLLVLKPDLLAASIAFLLASYD